MEKLIMILRQHSNMLSQRLSDTTNPIEYIKLSAQLGTVNEILNMSERLNEEAKAESKKAAKPKDDKADVKA